MISRKESLEIMNQYFFYFKLFSNAFFEYSEVKENKDVLECIFQKDYVDALALLKEYTASLNI